MLLFKNKNNLKSQLSSLVLLYDTLQKLVTETGIDRGLILRTSNGGGIPTFKTPIYFSITHEVHSEKVKGIKGKYQSIQADRDYVALIIKLMEDKVVDLEIDKMPDSLLKNAYEAEGIKFARIIYLSEDDKGVYYMSLSSLNAIIENPSEKVTYLLAVSRLIQLFNKK